MATFTATLLENQVLAPPNGAPGARTYVLHLARCEALASCRPGQFVMLRGEWGRDPLLPRAFSVMAVRQGSIAEILVKTIGRATSLLEVARPGARLQVLGPLGTTFPAPTADRTDWLIAGGVGLAPLLFQAEMAARAGTAATTRLFYGGRTVNDLVLLDRLGRAGVELALTTEDGSRGTPGRVTAALEAALDAEGSRPTLFACGPDPMLHAVARIARARGLKTYLSLEGEMACGIGVCLGCAVATISKPYRYTCTEGPVIDLDELRGYP
jgi:dihydroorotate dehydrogenase electron transfer subunit